MELLGSIFGHLMEKCLGDQQYLSYCYILTVFVTLLQASMAFSIVLRQYRLKKFNLKSGKFLNLVLFSLAVFSHKYKIKNKNLACP